MILYRQATDEDFDFTFKIKASSTKNLVEKIWGWDDVIHLDYLKNQFKPNTIKIIIDGIHEVNYISTFITGNILFIENSLTDTVFQGRNIGIGVLHGTIETAFEQYRNIELQVFKINTRAKKLYERLNFHIIEQTELQDKMRYEQLSATKKPKLTK